MHFLGGTETVNNRCLQEERKGEFIRAEDVHFKSVSPQLWDVAAGPQPVLGGFASQACFCLTKSHLQPSSGLPPAKQSLTSLGCTLLPVTQPQVSVCPRGAPCLLTGLPRLLLVFSGSQQGASPFPTTRVPDGVRVSSRGALLSRGVLKG